MNQPGNFPEFHAAGLIADSRAHLLGAITSAYAGAEELARGNQRSALIEIDRVIVLAHEARKFLLNNPGVAAAPVPASPRKDDDTTLLASAPV